MNVQSMTKNLTTQISKNSPTILTGLSVAGLISTTILAVRATPKAMELIQEERYQKAGEDLTKKEIIQVTYKCYIPAAVMGTVTIACIIGANTINLRRNAAIASLYSISEKTMKEYQNKVVETFGKNKEQKVKDEIAKDRVHKNPTSDNEIIITGKGETLCYDALSGRYFKSDIEEIKRVMNKLSRDLLSEMFLSMNQVYSELGLRGTKMGDLVGWHVADGLIEPRFSSQLTENGTPCLVIDFDVEPRYYDGFND